MFSKYSSSTFTKFVFKIFLFYLKAKYVFKIFLFYLKAKCVFKIFLLYLYFAQKPVSAKAEFKKNRDGMGFMIEGDVRINKSEGSPNLT